MYAKETVPNPSKHDTLVPNSSQYHVCIGIYIHI